MKLQWNQLTFQRPCACVCCMCTCALTRVVYCVCVCVYATGQIAVDKFGRNSVRSSIIVDYDEKANMNIVAPLFAAKTEHLYPIPRADSNMRNMQCSAGMAVKGTNQFCLSGNGDASVYGAVGEFCGTYCVDCNASTYSPVAGSLECSTCPKNSFSDASKKTQCSLCLPGQWTNGKTGATSCESCQSGTFNHESGQDCRICPAGSFSLLKSNEKEGASECVRCKDLPGFFYQPQSKQNTCLECPVMLGF